MTEMKSIEIDLEVNALIEGSRHSFSETANDILRRLLVKPGEEPLAKPTLPRPPEFDPVPGERNTGRWTVEVQGRTVAASNLKGAYRSLLLFLHELDPDFLARFSQEKARSRRFVARSPKDLYLASPDLAKNHAKPLVAGWYFDTNLSTDQVARRARTAARLAGLRYGRDVRILNNFEEI